MKKLGMIIIVFLIQLKPGYTQSVDSFQLNKRTQRYIYDLVLQNYLSFQTYRVIKGNQKLIDKGMINQIDFGKHLLDSGEFYDLKIDIVKGYYFPLKDYILIEVSNFNTVYTKLYGKDIENNFGYDRLISAGNIIYKFDRYMNQGLIAFDTLNKNILFLSGPFFTENIKAHYFKNSNINRDAMEEYVKVKYFSYKPDKIIVDEKNSLVSFLSSLNQKMYIVKFKKTTKKEIMETIVEYSKLGIGK